MDVIVLLFKDSGPLRSMQKDETQADALAHLLRYFPEVSLPVTITSASQKAFFRENKPLPALLTALFIDEWEGGPADEFTEYLPGFHFRLGALTGLVYWKAALMSYTYVLVLLDKQGQWTDRMVLAEWEVAPEGVRQGVALIQEDGSILMAESALEREDDLGDPTQTITERWQVTSEGRFTERPVGPNT